MDPQQSLSAAKAFLESHLAGRQKRTSQQVSQCFVTISRQAGAGGVSIAGKIVRNLNEGVDPAPPMKWTVFNQNLVGVVLQQHGLTQDISKYMHEDDVNMIQDIMEETFGLHPSSATLVHKTGETILQLAKLGHCVIVGRGANIVTHRLASGVHIRLVAPLQSRVMRMRDVYQLDDKGIARTLEEQDDGRRAYIKSHFGKNIDDPLLYDLIVNTNRITDEETADLVTERVHRLEQADRAG